MLKRLKERVESLFALGFADVVNLFIFGLTILAIGISIFSLWVAIQTKRSADASGEEQGKVLTSSLQTLRQSQSALESVTKTLDETNKTLDKNVTIALEQQHQLELQVRTTQGQLEIATQEWKRDLARPDIAARIVNARSPAVEVFNVSEEKPVIEGSYQLLLANLDHPIDGGYQAVSNPSERVDWIRPGGSYLPSILNLVALPSGNVKDGDHLFGYLSVDCRDCKTHRVYGVYMKYHQNGYYKELSSGEYWVVRSATLNMDDRVNAFLSMKGLISIE